MFLGSSILIGTTNLGAVLWHKLVDVVEVIGVLAVIPPYFISLNWWVSRYCFIKIDYFTNLKNDAC